MRLHITARLENWSLAQPFVISRGAKNEAVVVVAEASDGRVNGYGECVPYGRYGETAADILAQIASQTDIENRDGLLEAMPAGAARNAIDCALWDFEAKRSGTRVFEILRLGTPTAVETFYTLSLGAPEDMAKQAEAARPLRLLKLKLGGESDIRRMEMVRRARPDARLIADANEAWSKEHVQARLNAAADLGFELIEQPLPSEDDELLAQIRHAVPVCADESLRTSCDLDGIKQKYDAVNIKLDKAGGLTAALRLARAARAQGLKIMIGSMVGTSLSMAPALHLAPLADWVDLDSPLLLAKDRTHGLVVCDGLIEPSSARLWG